jgi:hypothetical protein
VPRVSVQRLIKAVAFVLCFNIVVPLHAADSVAVENAKAGTSDWQLTHPANMWGSGSTDPNTYANVEIQGYASRTSVNQAETINFYIRTINTNPYNMSIYRIGWYNGLGGRLMLGPITLPGVVQPMPQPPVFQPAGSGLVECNWSVSYSLTIPTDWVSGYYLVKLSLPSPQAESYIVFVVRDDARNSPILAQASFATYAAYNEWGGSSLYTLYAGQKTGYKVSFNRPFWPNFGAGNFLSLYGGVGYEINMVRWLERQGYDVTYATDLDSHENPSLLLSHKVYLIGAHDEYWSWNMRDTVEGGRDAGVYLAFLGANASYWQVRFEPSSTGDPDRTMVGYKELAAMDHPSDPRYTTTLWRNIRPEAAMIGVEYNGVSYTTPGNIVITNAAHWLFRGTGLSNGDILPNILGYETDSIDSNSPVGTVDLAHSPFPSGAPQVYADMSIYTAASGANVFATGSVWWSLGLDSYGPSPGAVPGVQQITANFLAQALLPSLSLLSLNPTTVTSGNPSTGTVSLNGPAPAGGAQVTLSSSDPSVASVPPTVTVPAGATSATFTVNTSVVATSNTVSISASYAGLTQTASLSLIPLVITSLSLNPPSVTGGNPSFGTVTLNGPAPAGGAQVTLSSSDPSVASVPPSILVPAGATTTTFTVPTNLVIFSTTVTISTTYNASSQSADLAVHSLVPLL